jgi:Flp pilus assembly protein TadB
MGLIEWDEGAITGADEVRPGVFVAKKSTSIFTRMAIPTDEWFDELTQQLKHSRRQQQRHNAALPMLLLTSIPSIVGAIHFALFLNSGTPKNGWVALSCFIVALLGWIWLYRTQTP